MREVGLYVPSEAVNETQPRAPADTPAAADDSGSGPPGRELTPRQWRVLALMAKGLSNEATGRELGIGEITVKAHVSAILRKLGLGNRVQAVLVARKRHHTGD